MKKYKSKIILVSVLSFILCITLLIKTPKTLNKKIQEELIFFKIFSSFKNEISNQYKKEKIVRKQYKFNVSLKNTQLKPISLLETINPQTLVKEKIAPRNKWKF